MKMVTVDNGTSLEFAIRVQFADRGTTQTNLITDKELASEEEANALIQTIPTLTFKANGKQTEYGLANGDEAFFFAAMKQLSQAGALLHIPEDSRAIIVDVLDQLRASGLV